MEDHIISEEIKVKNEEFSSAVYDLSGRKIHSQFNINKGIYILNGKKVIKR